MIHVEYGFTETKNVLILPIRPNDHHAHTNLSVGGTGYRWANYGREGAALPSGPDNSVLVNYFEKAAYCKAEPGGLYLTRLHTLSAAWLVKLYYYWMAAQATRRQWCSSQAARAPSCLLHKMLSAGSSCGSATQPWCQAPALRKTKYPLLPLFTSFDLVSN
jgi:hypothetical protein